MRYLNTLSVLALASTSLAQTFSDCDPTKKTGCPTKPGLSTADFSTDFTQGAAAASQFTTTTGVINYVADGAEYSITKLGEGPTMQSNFYIQFGYVEVVMKAAPGAGIVSSFVMESDALDEIDWEWIGSDAAQAQSNYFGKGNTTTYDRGQFHPVTAPETTFVKYAVNWTAESTTWLINDAPVRTLMFADAVGGKNYPQTPMNIRLGNWVAGAPTNSPGTIQWAGGLADFSKGPFNMYVQSLKVVNYNPATSYAYNDMSGTFQSISALGAPAQASLDTSSGDTNSTGPGEVPFASASASASDSASASMATDSSDGSDSSGSAESMPAAAAAATSGSGSSGGAASVVSIKLGGSGVAAAGAATKSPCSTITKSGAQGAAAAASATGKASVVSINLGSSKGAQGLSAAAAATGSASGTKPSVISINLGKPGMMGPGAAAATAMSGGKNSTSSGQGIVAAGAPANGTLATVTIKPGGAAAAASTLKTGVTGAPVPSTASAQAANGGTSFGIGASTTSAQAAAQVTTNAGSRLEMGGAALAAFAGLMAAL